MLLRRNRLAAFLAVLALALQAFWPLLAQARPRIAGILVPVCTVEGTTHYLELPAGKSPLDERSASHGEHCKLCVFGGGKLVSAASFDVSAFLAGNADQGIAFRRTPLREFPLLLSAHPRAPPAVS
ncbi:MAG TPA: DUF2946 family protein [Burkholderiales bacterium]|nr:DUF2946 family protein [Burkholderiales bacterium]